ncbi:MAG: DegT/DnrJ/EryC1/StrS family aminotransferase [Gammaproteobacteria bacterium]|nr:DegT/DnrJ/EryC1/StrS family aminotransferase [Gammaproteobacteria bacterium]
MKIPLKILRPVGNPIHLQKAQVDFTQFHPFQVDFYHSGTAALAAAIIACKKLKSEVDSNAEVILPAYGCPDLISAILYAGARPVLVDLDPNTTWMSLNAISHAITERTVAIVAVRFLGISERMQQLRDICSIHKLTLIEDSAQGFPVTGPATYWHGDFNILSFGRGKPVNLLSGGAVLCTNPELQTLLPKPLPSENSLKARSRYLIKAAIYNTVINPWIYGLVTNLPGLNIGETIYKPLSELKGMPDFVAERLNANIRSYLAARDISSLIYNKLRDSKMTGIIDLASASNHDFSNPLLRYPLLVKNKYLRDKLYRSLLSQGASIMYKQPVYKISGIPTNIFHNSTKDCQNAQALADQLITLPTHQDVSVRGISHMLARVAAEIDHAKE